MAEGGGTRWLYLEPIDTWIFGDGRSNRAGEDQSDLGCLFPPSPLTVAGAIRAAAARALGWSGRPTEAWAPAITAQLGDGLDCGPLRFTGPFLAKDGQPLFPAPAHMLGIMDDDGTWRPKDLLAPGRETVTDLPGGPVRLPERVGLTEDDPGGLQRPDGVWLTARGLSQALAGELPSTKECVHDDDLFVFERRTELALDAASRTAREGHLYSPLHVRCRRRVGLMVGVAGLNAEVRIPPLVPLGGDGRMASCEVVDPPTVPASRSGEAAGGWRSLLALTPTRMLDSEEVAWEVPGPGDPTTMLIPGVEDKIVSLCVERPLRLGGWDSVHRRPLPLTPFVRPGTVWFLDRETPLPSRLPRAGSLTDFGFGHLTIGSVPAAASTPHHQTV